MLRKKLNKIFNIRRKYSLPALDSDKSPHGYGDEANPDETDTARVFRHTFIDKFELFRQQASLFADGKISLNDEWQDTLGKEGLGVSVTLVVGVISILGALLIMSAAASAGVSVAVAVVGIAAGVAFYKYREHVKQQSYEVADAMMMRDEIHEDICYVAQELADLYRVQLASCTVKDAHALAESCMKAISEAMLKDDDFRFVDLLHPSSLQAFLMKSQKHVPKTKLDMNLNSHKKYNARGMVSHAAYYVRETGEFYQFDKSKPAKYGVLFFERKDDLEDYEYIIRETIKDAEKWKLTKMPAHEVRVLKSSSMFKAYQNDKEFEVEESSPRLH